MNGKGSLVLTGQLGDVMKESAQAALSFIRSRARWLGLEENFLEKTDIHVHIPAGAIPKDGPSAGVTMFVAMASLLTGKPIRNDVAMTGEITLRGLVLPVGGIKEKFLAAHRAGIKRVILPERNRKDIIEIPDQPKKEIEILFVKRMDELLPLVLDRDAQARRHDGPRDDAARRRRRPRRRSSGSARSDVRRRGDEGQRAEVKGRPRALDGVVERERHRAVTPGVAPAVKVNPQRGIVTGREHEGSLGAVRRRRVPADEQTKARREDPEGLPAVIRDAKVDNEIEDLVEVAPDSPPAPLGQERHGDAVSDDGRVQSHERVIRAPGRGP